MDIDLAPRNAAGLVEFSADLLVLRPKDAAKSNGTAFLEIANRGSSPFWGALNIGASRDMPGKQEMGDISCWSRDSRWYGSDGSST